jgi:hypothetical protein
MLIASLLCASLQSQAGDASTQNYQQAALRPGVSEDTIGKPIRIESSESSATISTVLLLTSDAQPHPGTRVVIRGASGADDLYIDVNDAAQLREDFASFANWREADLKCEAIAICVQGVERCSPSMPDPNAICPATYSTPEGERGVIISTAIGSFRFPSAKTSTFVDALDASLEQISTMHVAQ